MVDVGGAALGAPFGWALQELYALLKNAVQRARMFKSRFRRLKLKLETLDKMAKQITELNRRLDNEETQITNFTDKMEEGKELVGKCMKIRKWDFYKKSRYASKLSTLEDDIQNFIICFFLPFNAVIGLKIANDIHNGPNLGVRNGGLSCTVPPSPRSIVGLDKHVKELKRKLLHEKVSMLVISADGGCGKTTLVKKLCEDQDIKGTYSENIFFIQVSEIPNLKVIVSNLFDRKRELGEFRGDGDIIDQLGVLLKQIKSSILLILDDVWSESFLENFEFDIPNYQIVVTSRIAFKGNGFTYELPVLNDEDAGELLRYSAGLQEGSSLISDEDMQKMILKVCGGYPLAIKVTGGSLRGQPLEAWQSWVEEQYRGDSTTIQKVLGCLKKSFDVLDDVVKECFLDLGLFPEDRRIPVTVLIDMWAELHKLDADGWHAIINLHEITRRNLARLVVVREARKDVGKYYNEDFVLQHDLLRKLAINQSNHEPITQRERLIVNIIGNNLPEWWAKQKLLRIKARILSISTDVEFCSNWCNIQPSKVEVLVLNFQAENCMLPKFIKKMYKLKVLTITNYGFSYAELSNFRLLKYAPCLKKIRLEKVSIPSLYNQLRSLEKISLFMCNIGQAFATKISILLPKLMEINIDYCNDMEELPDGLCESTYLKKLSITNCHRFSNLPQRFGELTNLEVLRLKSCTDLLGLPESIRKLHKLRILDISDCLSITKLPKHIGELCNLEKLHMEGCLKLRHGLPSSTLDLDQLKVVTCDEVIAKSWESVREYLSNLQVEVPTRDVNLNWLL